MNSSRLWLGLCPVLVGCGLGAGPVEDTVPTVDHQPVEAKRYFPAVDGPWESEEPAAVGWNEDRLAAVLDYAKERRSTGLVIVIGGRILAEADWELADRDDVPGYSRMLVGRTPDGRSIEDVASVQKSVLSFLAGVAVGKGLLDLDLPVSDYVGAGWSDAPSEAEQQITVRHIMSMSSGLGADHTYELPAGEKWMYNTNVYSRLGAVLEEVTGLGLNALSSEWLFLPVGMSESRWGARPWVQASQDANAIGFQTTARDLARFGLLIQANGVWDGTRLIADERFIEQSLSASQVMNPAYGLLWWLNSEPITISLVDGSAAAEPSPLAPSAPRDMVAAVGALGRRVYIVPSLDLVVTRLGDAPGHAFDEELWTRLIAAAP